MSLSRRETVSETDSAKTAVSSKLLHDLRSSLNQIIGYSEMMNEEPEGEGRENFGPDLQRIGAAGHRMLALIEENFTSDRGKPLLVGVMDDDVDIFDETATGRTKPPAAPGLILVVDDDAANRDVLSRRLI